LSLFHGQEERYVRKKKKKASEIASNIAEKKRNGYGVHKKIRSEGSRGGGGTKYEHKRQGISYKKKVDPLKTDKYSGINNTIRATTQKGDALASLLARERGGGGSEQALV